MNTVLLLQLFVGQMLRWRGLDSYTDINVSSSVSGSVEKEHTPIFVPDLVGIRPRSTSIGSACSSL
jgi:hypothetical protein